MTKRLTISSRLMAFLVLFIITSGLYGKRVRRLAGGEDANIEEYPYQVSLRYGLIHICGGALISERHVLTAAHCVCGLIDEPYENLMIRTGTSEINQGGNIFSVKNIICHPGFKFGLDSSWENDLVVITLKGNVASNGFQAPIALPVAETSVDILSVVTGWGRSSPYGPLHRHLQKLSVKTLTNTVCQSYYNNTILSSQICTLASKGVGACKGDSGSPLVSGGILIGIFSWTKPCALGSPDVFSRIHHFTDFIKTNMEFS